MSSNNNHRSRRNGKPDGKAATEQTDRSTTFNKVGSFKGHTLADAQLFVRLKTQQIAAVHGYEEIINRSEFTLNEPANSYNNDLTRLQTQLLDVKILQQFQPQIQNQVVRDGAVVQEQGQFTPVYTEFRNCKTAFNEALTNLDNLLARQPRADVDEIAAFTLIREERRNQLNAQAVILVRITALNVTAGCRSFYDLKVIIYIDKLEQENCQSSWPESHILFLFLCFFSQWNFT